MTERSFLLCFAFYSRLQEEAGRKTPTTKQCKTETGLPTDYVLQFCFIAWKLEDSAVIFSFLLVRVQATFGFLPQCAKTVVELTSSLTIVRVCVVVAHRFHLGPCL